jgi:hypothetical protein
MNGGLAVVLVESAFHEATSAPWNVESVDGTLAV